MYKDNFEMFFKNEKEMKDFLDELEMNSFWQRCSIKKIRTMNTDKINPAKYTDLSDLEIYTDTVENTGLYQIISDKVQPFPVRNVAMKTIMDRNRFSGQVFRDMRREEVADFINLAAKYAKKETYIRVMGGKISAELSEDYVILPMNEIFQIASNSLSEQFEEVSFSHGHFDYCVTEMEWHVKDKMICKAYEEILGGTECNSEMFSLGVKICTSDTGYSGANINYKIIHKSKKIYLSHSLKMDHKGNASMESFRSNTLKIFARYQETLMDLRKLHEIRIQFPQNCMTAVMKKAGISAKLIGDTVEYRKMVTSPGPTNALDLYYDICQCVDLAMANGLVKERQLSDLEEKVAGIIGIKWKNYDISSEVLLNV